ncbi:MAG: secretin N-terminal domain-containing protein [Paracoccaceae bacterium]
MTPDKIKISAVALAIGVIGSGALQAEAPKTCPSGVCEKPLATVELSLKVLDMPLPDFFALLQVESGERIVPAPEVRGRVADLDLTGTPEDMIAAVATQNDLSWFRYDGAYYVSRKRDAITRLVPLQDLSTEEAHKSLADSGLATGDGRIVAVAGGNALSVSGPPDYVAFAEAILELTKTSAPSTPETSVIRVRRGTATSLEYYGRAGMVASHQVEQPPAAAAQGQSGAQTAPTENAEDKAQKDG